MSGPATIHVLMFAAGQVATGIATAATWLFQVSGVAAGFVLSWIFGFPKPCWTSTGGRSGTQQAIDVVGRR